MAIYTLSINYIDRVGMNQSHLHNVFLKFSNPESEHKVAVDKTKRILELYEKAAQNNVDIQTWLDWMSRSKNKFEFIDIEIPDGISEYELYLLIAHCTQPYKKIIVDSHQYYKDFKYLNGCNKVLFKEIEITILDKDEAYKELNQQPIIQNLMPLKNNPWNSGSFYLTSLILIIACISIAAVFMSIIYLPIIIIGAIIAVTIIGALQLKNDGRLHDKNFMKLMALTLKRLFLLKSNNNNSSSSDL